MKTIELLQHRINKMIPNVCENIESITLSERPFDDIIDITIRVNNEEVFRSVKNDFGTRYDDIWDVIHDVDTDYLKVRGTNDESE